MIQSVTIIYKVSFYHKVSYYRIYSIVRNYSKTALELYSSLPSCVFIAFAHVLGGKYHWLVKCL